MVSMKEYAARHGVSYEAVRKQVARYSAELEGHISIRNRTKYLDEFAEKFLNEKRQQSAIIIHEQAKEDELDAAKAENEELRKALQQAMLTIQKLQADQIAMLHEKVETTKQLEDQSRLQRDLKEMQDRAESAESENRKYKRTWFGLYKKTDEE